MPPPWVPTNLSHLEQRSGGQPQPQGAQDTAGRHKTVALCDTGFKRSNTTLKEICFERKPVVTVTVTVLLSAHVCSSAALQAEAEQAWLCLSSVAALVAHEVS